MLPLVSKISPTATGSSSMANCTMGCSTLSSKRRKFSFSRPDTGRFILSLTLTGTSTSWVSTRRLGRDGSVGGDVLDRGGRGPCASAHSTSPAVMAVQRAPIMEVLYRGRRDGG